MYPDTSPNPSVRSSRATGTRGAETPELSTRPSRGARGNTRPLVGFTLSPGLRGAAGTRHLRSGRGGAGTSPDEEGSARPPHRDHPDSYLLRPRQSHPRGSAVNRGRSLSRARLHLRGLKLLKVPQGSFEADFASLPAVPRRGAAAAATGGGAAVSLRCPLRSRPRCPRRPSAAA